VNPPSSDGKPLYKYSREAFVALGFDQLAADLLSSEGVSYPDVEKMIKNGCSHELAIRIVL
jgi:hypothetical protein